MDDDPEPTGTTTTQAPTTDAEATTSRFSEVPTDALADRLSRWASSLAAAECEFLDLLAEFDARQAWGESGMRSTAHWLSWRLGLRLGVAREKVRVARALQRLPLVHDEFAAGALSYCKVRALSRVATDATEAELVHIARGATGAQLETVVRQWRRTLIGDTTASSHIRRGRPEPDRGRRVLRRHHPAVPGRGTGLRARHSPSPAPPSWTRPARSSRPRRRPRWLRRSPRTLPWAAVRSRRLRADRLVVPGPRTIRRGR